MEQDKVSKLSDVGKNVWDEDTTSSKNGLNEKEGILKIELTQHNHKGDLANDIVSGQTHSWQLA